MWEFYDEDDMNRPDKLEHYIMMLACQVARVLSKTPNTIQPHHFQLTFSRKDVKVNKEDVQKQLEFSKSMRIASLGGMGMITQVDAQGNVIKAAQIPPKKNNLPLSPRGETTTGVNTNADTSGARGASNQVHGGHTGSKDTNAGDGESTQQNRKRRRRI